MQVVSVPTPFYIQKRDFNCSLAWGLKQIPFQEKGDDASNQHSSPGQGDLTPRTSMERRLSFVRQSCYCHC